MFPMAAAAAQEASPSGPPGGFASPPEKRKVGAPGSGESTKKTRKAKTSGSASPQGGASPCASPPPAKLAKAPPRTPPPAVLVAMAPALGVVPTGRAAPGRAQQYLDSDGGLQHLLATSPRPGGLLDAMRARGVLQFPGAAAAVRPAPFVPAPLAAVASAPTPARAAAAAAAEVAQLGASMAAPAAAATQQPPPQRAAPARPAAKRNAGAKRKQVPPVPKFSAKPREPEPWELLRQRPLPPKRPEDNYEMSDKEDSADESEEPDRSGKYMPEWSEDWTEQLARQEGVDPDSIFGPKVPMCNLDLIFPDVLYKAGGAAPARRKRGSSCQWHRDRLSRSEIVAYRQKMGQLRRWSSLSESLRKRISVDGKANAQ